MDVAMHIAMLSQVSNQPDLPGPELLPARLMRAAAAALPIAAAGISGFTPAGHRVPMGEGPCLSVHGTGEALLATDEIIAQRWPTFHAELVARTPFRSILSVPLDQPGLGGDAAMDLYYEHPDQLLEAEQLEDVQDAADVTAVLLVTKADGGTGNADGSVWLDSVGAVNRQRVWTALGMINVGLQLNTG